MKDFIKRLSSRKLLITIATMIVISLFPGLPDAVVNLALTYVGAEGLRDVIDTFRRADVNVAQTEKEVALINMGEYAENSEALRGNIKPGKSIE